MDMHSGETATRISNDCPRYRHKMPAAIFMLADDGRILESNAEGKHRLTSMSQPVIFIITTNI